VGAQWLTLAAALICMAGTTAAAFPFALRNQWDHAVVISWLLAALYWGFAATAVFARPNRDEFDVREG
jgi:hypothetical protein